MSAHCKRFDNIYYKYSYHLKILFYTDFLKTYLKCKKILIENCPYFFPDLEPLGFLVI